MKNFDSVRQIVETRLLSLAGESYQSFVVGGETLSTIVTKNPVVGSISNLKTLNPTYTTFDNDLLIAFGSNSTVVNAGLQVAGFPGGFISETRVAEGGTLGTILTSLAFHNGPGTEVTAPFNQFLRIDTPDRFASVTDKIISWVNSINGETDLGFTAQAEADGFSMRITPKVRSNTFEPESVTISLDNGFNGSLDYTYIGPRTWNLIGRDFSLFLEGRQFTQPTTGKFAILQIQDASVVGREFGTSKTSRRRSGNVRVKLFAQHGTGTKVVRDMADEFDSVLSYSAGDTGTGAGGTLFMRAGSLRQVSEDNDGFLEYNLDYIYDYYTS